MVGRKKLPFSLMPNQKMKQIYLERKKKELNKIMKKKKKTVSIILQKEEQTLSD